jgi:hypothetical protein
VAPDQKTGIRPVYDEFFRGYRAGLVVFYAEFPMNWTYKLAYTRGPFKSAASTRIVEINTNKGSLLRGNVLMLTEFLQKAIGLNADRLEIEYKDRKEWVTAFRGNLGFGIGSIDSTKRDELFEDFERLRKSKRATLLGNVYRMSFSESESFGETVYEIRWKRENRPQGST